MRMDRFCTKLNAALSGPLFSIFVREIEGNLTNYCEESRVENSDDIIQYVKLGNRHKTVASLPNYSQRIRR